MSVQELVKPSVRLMERPVDDPTPEIRIGLAVIAVFFVGFLGWAALAPMDVAAFMSGAVAVDDGPKSVQSRDGGVVQALYVKEGARVQKGQVLVDLASGDARQTVQSLAGRTMARHAELARLDAERRGLDVVEAWPGFETLTGEEAVLAAQQLEVERGQLATRRAAARTEKAMLAQRITQGRQQVIAAEREVVALGFQKRAIGKELTSMRSLEARGYTPRIRVTELERTAAALEGSAGSREADVARLHSGVAEAQLQMADFDMRRDRELADQIRAAQDDLRALEPQLAAAKEVLRRSQVRAPVAGQVFASKVNTVGGVVAPGEVIMRIVPQETVLIVDAKIMTRDSGGVTKGQAARIKFPALHDQNRAPVEGVITQISADSYSDEKSGAEFYRVQVTVPQAEVTKLKREMGGQGLSVGMPADVTVTLKKRTALQYFIQPLTQRFGRSFHEF
ncbi:HlyD family type I secretion periplasmic adaptor subunit [Phenylobacterium sp. LjRoot225]|uniref:HlyD family type I secretion periplasmic adaptor subunit n=1 Tax=Phenylobacterium sp. LjRoot225 TaxID=3342285 RepID=UPI003ECC99A8